MCGCGKDKGGGTTPQPITEVEVTLEELDPDNPPSEPTWVVTNDNITTSEDLDILKEALTTVADTGQQVEVVLASVETLPDNSFTNCEVLTAISLPAVTTISESTFEGCVALTTISVPVVEEVAANAFSGCEALEEISLPATKKIGSGAFASCGALSTLGLATDVELESMAADAFLSSSTSVGMTRSDDASPTLSITLSISSLNWDYISGNTLAIGEFSGEFKLIIILGLQDLDPSDSEINDWEETPLQ